jgi:hypothetical protein
VCILCFTLCLNWLSSVIEYYLNTIIFYGEKWEIWGILYVLKGMDMIKNEGIEHDGTYKTFVIFLRLLGQQNLQLLHLSSKSCVIKVMRFCGEKKCFYFVC